MRHDQAIFSSISAPLIPQDAKAIFVADAFAREYGGGAELTLQALIDTAPCKVHTIHCSELTLEHVKQGVDKHWIFGNYASLNPQLVPAIAQNLRYSIVECDYKFCRYRSIEKHEAQTGMPCDCATTQIGTLIASFMAAADQVWWMSEAQRDVHHKNFPMLADYQQRVLGSVFDDSFFETIETLRAKHPTKNGKWLVLDHPSWIKGTKVSLQHAVENKLDYKLVGNLPYAQMLEELAQAEGLVFTPLGGDTCPRLVIEAKLLGCKMLLNDNVQHAKESWFDTDDLDAVENHLLGLPELFWRVTAKHMARDYTLSGYATTFNCVKQEYPFEACIESLLGFCDEVVVVDAGSTDGTLDVLKNMQVKFSPTQSQLLLFSCTEDRDAHFNKVSKLKVHIVERDWSDPRSALFDGMQKAEARRRCTGDFVWQQDVDEVVRHEDWPKVRELVKNFPKAVPLISLPVIEGWGSWDKIRLDINPQKWRLSRNSPRITHGVPIGLRDTDSEGRTIAKPETDGCDMIDVNTGEPIVFLGFLTNEMEAARQAALQGDVKALEYFQSWFQKVIDNVPSVLHHSWINIERKIRLYSTQAGTYGWTRHWEQLTGKKYEDTADSNMFFDKPWSDVTNEDIKLKAKELTENTGGHVFHVKYRGQKTPWMKLRLSHDR